MKNANTCHRTKIAKAILRYAKEQKVGVDRAIGRAMNSGRFDAQVETYRKSKKIGVDAAWRRVVNTVYTLVTQD
jgi:hypothetical protein